MKAGVGTVLSVLGVAFTAYLAAGALLWTTAPQYPLLQVSAVALYLLTTWVCIFWKVPRAAGRQEPRRFGERTLLPAWAAALAIAVAVIVPSATWIAAGHDGRLADYGTWAIGGVGALMAIVMVRRRPWTAWIGVVLVAVAAIGWIGVSAALAFAFVGDVLWVAVAQLLTWLVDRAARDTAQLTDMQRAASEWLASQESVRRERRTLIQRALAVAGPILAHTITVAGRLDETERQLARIAEGTLRDELRGAALLDDEVRAALSSARARGTVVSVLDEGGLDDLSADERAALRGDLARVLTGARSQRLFVRTSTHDQIALTVVGRSAGDDGEDAVDLWHEFARRPAPERQPE